MFHKDASSLGKNNRTVPLRKSDRRRLRQAADDLLRKRIPHVVVDATTSAVPATSTPPDVLTQYLDLAFVRGVLVARPIHHDVLGKVTLYWRSPASSAEDVEEQNDKEEAASTTALSSPPRATTATTTVKWPYRFTTQCIWIHVDPPPSGTMQQLQQAQEAPTVALMAVLSAYCPEAVQLPTVVVHSAVSKFLCRGAHLMRAGIVQLTDVVVESATTPATTNNKSNNASNNKGNNNNNKGNPNNRNKPNNTNHNKTPIIKKPPPQPILPIVGIQVRGNPQIMGIGQLTAGTTPSTVGPARKGIAVHVWTCYGDDLWNQQLSSSMVGQKQHHQTASLEAMSKDCIMNITGGSFFDDGNYGNVGFLQGEIVRPIQRRESDQDSDDDEEEDDEEGEEEDQVTNGDEIGPSRVVSKLESLTLSPDNERQGAEETVASTDNTTESIKLHDNNSMNGGETLETAQGESATPLNETNPHDLILHQAVCQALVMIQDKQLPMTTATFYAQYVIPNRPPDTTLQLGQTSYKKFSKYLVAQVERDLLQVGPDPKTKDPVAFLTKINRRHEDVRETRKTTTATIPDTSKTKSKKLAVVDLFVIPHHWVKLMRLDTDQVKAVHAKSEERRGTGMLTMPEARAILDSYIASESLIDSSRPEMIHLDGPLTDIVFPKAKKRDDSVPDTPPPLQLTRKELVERWTDKLEQAFALVEMPGSHIRRLGKGKPPEVSFEVSMRQGKKYITRLRGLEEYGVDASEFSKEVAKRFACAAAVDTDPKGAALKKGHVELVFQGHLVDELRALLLGDDRLSSHGGAKGSPYCLPSSAIRVTLKKGVPAKKKK